MNNSVNWDDFSRWGLLRGVLDPNDAAGTKNLLIDQIQWQAIARKLVPAGKLLDYGCGTGRFAGRIAGRGLRYSGVDTSQGMIAAAKGYHPHMASSFSVVTEGPALPFPDKTFDCCLTTMVLQYLIKTPAADNVLRELWRVLRPGGTVVIVEQVSKCQRTSGSVANPATEKDYLNLLAPHFKIKRLERIRSSSLGRVASWMISHNAADNPLAKRMLSLVARFERRKIQFAPDTYLHSIDYYDICIKAEKDRE